MPTRWLSIRKRNPLHQTFDSRNPTKQQGFDFAFNDSATTNITSTVDNKHSTLHLNARPVDLPRPKTSGSPGKRKIRVEVPQLRPRTSDKQKPSALHDQHSTLRAEDNYIGLAFGSPGHPPKQFTDFADDASPEDKHYPPGVEKVRQMQSKRWKKFGVLFKTRQPSVRRDEISYGPTIGLPTGLVVLDKSPTTPASRNEFSNLQASSTERPKIKTIPPPPIDKSPRLQPSTSEKSATKSEDDIMSRPSTATDAESVVESYVRPPLPKLELDIPIPTPPFDRYSVMFKNVPANRSSSLLARRSKALESLKSFEDSRPTTKGGEDELIIQSNTEVLTPLVPPRRLTTPSTRSPAHSKYSLFPTPSPAPVKIVGRIPFTQTEATSPGLLKRSATSPARLSPMQDHFSLIKPEPLNTRRFLTTEAVVHSPEDNTASTDRSNPWSAVHSLQSSMSSNTTVDDIFFDIRLFRDSKGVEDGNFVMTRPDSAAVELVRTRSKNSAHPFRPHPPRVQQPKAMVEHLAQLDPPPVPPSTTTTLTSTTTTKHTSVNTAYFDEAIAAVERLTLPRSHEDGEDFKLPPVNFSSPAPAPSIFVTNPTEEKPLHRAVESHVSRATGKSREDISRMIPSPVAELKEDMSPKGSSRTVSPLPSAKVQSPAKSQLTKVASPHVDLVKRLDRPIDDSPTLPQGPPIRSRPSNYVSSPLTPKGEKPPPVPEKDAKFIPLSKFAAKGTINAIERTGVTPQTRHLRNDSQASTPISVASKSKDPFFTSTTSASVHTTNSPSTSSTMTKQSLKGLEITIPPTRPNPVALNPVKTSDVVAVARTVSLSRKQSARVQINGSRYGPAGKQRSETHPQPGSISKSSQHNPNHQATSSQTSSHTHGRSSSKSNSGSGGGLFGHKHRRSNSKSQSRDKIRITKREVPLAESKEKEKAMIKEARKWEILEKKSYSPVVIQAERGHKPGMSVGLVVENI